MQTIRVLVISDSHGHLENVEKVMKRYEKLDMVIHLGDIIGQDERLRSMCNCPVTIVRGNCDFRSDNNIVEVISLGKNKVFATHGHHYSVDWDLERLFLAAKERGCNIAMYGHTHVPQVIKQEGIYIINPGSITKPRQLNHKPSYILMDMDENGKTYFAVHYL